MTSRAVPLRYDTVSFLSDYGHDDEYVGVCRSVLRGLAPDVAVIDIAHNVPAFDVRAGSLMLARAVPYLCGGVVMAVVDPGVGTSRRAVAVEVGDGDSVFVGPDNGLLGPAVAMVGGATRAVELTNPEYLLDIEAGRTFDGRDVFAPAAANLCLGVPLTELGPEVDPAGLLPGLLPVVRDEDGGLVAEVLWVDRFGNVQLNLQLDDVAPLGPHISLKAETGTRTLALVTAFAEIGAGAVGLMEDSVGLLSVAVDRGSAAEQLGLGVGDAVTLLPAEEPGSPVTPVSLGRRPEGS